MAQPTPPVLAYSFQSELGTAFGTHLDANFDELVTSINELITNIGLIQRDDGMVRNQTVHANAFSSDALALMAGASTGSDVDWDPLGTWVTATSYLKGNIVETGSPATAYVCAVTHISGVFATDYAAGKWVVLSAPRTLVSADITSALGYTPVNKAGDTMTGALVIPTGSKILGASGITFTDTYLATQDLGHIDKGLYSNYASSLPEIIYGFASNVVRSSAGALTVGGQFSAFGMSGVTNDLFGENSNAIALNGATGALVGHESDAACFEPSNTQAKIGYNAVFKNRGDGQTAPGAYSYTLASGTLSSAGAGLGANKYNYESRAFWISSQQRTLTGEYCGWNRGVLFSEYSLDSVLDTAYTGSRAYPIGIDFSEIHYYGGSDPVVGYNLEAAIAFRDLQGIWWNRDPATAATMANKVRTHFNPFTSRWVLSNAGVERFAVDVTTGNIYQNGSILGGGASLTGANTWTSAGSNTFEGPVTISSTFTFSGNGRRITGLFSGATITNRTLFQGSGTNLASEVGVIPNGTANEAGLYVLSDSAAANGLVGRIAVTPGQMTISSTGLGAVPAGPMVFAVGSEVMSITATGEVHVNSPLVATSAAKLVVNGYIEAMATPAFTVHRNGVVFNLTSATPTVVNFTDADVNVGSHYDLGTDRFTPPAGTYLLTGAFRTDSVAVDQGVVVAMVYKDGAQVRSGSFTPMSGVATSAGSMISCIVESDGTNYFEFVVYQSNGTATTLSISGAATDTYFQGIKIS